MRVRSIGFVAACAAGLLATAALAAGCVTSGGVTAPPGNSSTGSPAASASPAASPAATPDASPKPSGNCGEADLAAATQNPYTIASLARNDRGFLVGEVNEMGPAVFGLDASSDVTAHWRIFTPVDVRVERVLRGRTETGTAQLVFEGGVVGCHSERNNLAPDLETGKRYVFVTSGYLAQAGIVPADEQDIDFAWEIDASGIVHTSLGPQSLTSLALVLAEAEPSPSKR